MGDTSEESRVGKSPETTSNVTKEVTVLVTGYGPFLDLFPINASWSIVSRLPSHLPATPTCPSIQIKAYPSPIKVCYSTVHTLVPTLLSREDSYDMILHIGLAASRSFYTLERQAPRGPYWEKRDVEGQVFSRSETTELWPEEAFPRWLKPTVDTEDVWRRWRSYLNATKRGEGGGGEDIDIRPSDDPGNYLCGFIYYNSLAWFLARNRQHSDNEPNDDDAAAQQNQIQTAPDTKELELSTKENESTTTPKERPVLFLHVPDLPTPSDIQEGIDVAVALIRAMVESREKRGIIDPLLPAKSGEHAMGAAEIPLPALGRMNSTYDGWDGVS